MNRPWKIIALTTLLLATLPAATAEDHLEVIRFPNNPIIRPEMLPGHDGGNINGPSLIRVPAWLPQPLGKYYLYFANRGRFWK